MTLTSRKPGRPRPPLFSRTSVEEEERPVPQAAAPPVPPPPRRPPTLDDFMQGRSANVGPPRSILRINVGVILVIGVLAGLLLLLAYTVGLW